MARYDTVIQIQHVCVCLCVCVCMYVYMYMYLYRSGPLRVGIQGGASLGLAA